MLTRLVQMLGILLFDQDDLMMPLDWERNTSAPTKQLECGGQEKGDHPDGRHTGCFEDRECHEDIVNEDPWQYHGGKEANLSRQLCRGG